MYVLLSFNLTVPLCIYYDFQSSVFMGFLSVKMSGSQFLVSSFGLFIFCLFYPILMCSFYITTFYFIIIPKTPVSFLRRNK